MIKITARRVAIVSSIVAASLFASNISRSNRIRDLRAELADTKGQLEDIRTQFAGTKRQVALTARDMAISARTYSTIDIDVKLSCDQDETTAFVGMTHDCGSDAPEVMIPLIACFPGGTISVEETVYTYAKLLARIADDPKINKFIEETRPEIPIEELPRMCIAPEEPEIKARPRMDVRILPFLVVPNVEIPEEYEPEAPDTKKGTPL